MNILRQEPLNTAGANGRSTVLYGGPTSSRPMASRATFHQNPNKTSTSNFYYQLSGGTTGPLPAELISKRLSNGTSHNRISFGTGPLIVQQSIPPIHNEIRSTDTTNTHVSSSLRVPPKNHDTGLQQVDGFDYNSMIIDEYPDKFRVITSKKF